jgi:putative ABC transport system permease protein
MIRNYVMIAFRILKRQFLYSFINVVGLAVGLACTLVIFLYVYSEWSHDRHFKNGDRIFRIGVSFFNMGPFANGPELLGDILPSQFEGIQTFTRFQKASEERIVIGDNTFKELVYMVDSAFFKVFSYQFIYGDPATALKEPNSAVITERMAEKYFNETNAIGKLLEVGKTRKAYVITGIVRDDNKHSHLKSSIWLSWQVSRENKFTWTSAAVYNYVLLKQHVSEKELHQALDDIIAEYVYPASGAAENGISLEKFRFDENAVKFNIQPLKHIYFGPPASLELSPGGNANNLLIFSVIAAFILILAAVNFINLSTARATRRAKEIAIRKSLGTYRSRLVFQFLTESVILTILAMVLALGFAELFSLTFFWISQQDLAISIFTDPAMLLAVFAFAVLTGLIAGLYPAFYLTHYEPAKVLKGVLKSESGRLRNVLIVFQFSISICLIICTWVIVSQLNFMASKNLGFNPENIVTIDNMHLLKDGAEGFADQIRQLPGVAGVSLHSGEPGSKSMIVFYTYQTPVMKESLTINTYLADDQFIEVLGLKLIAGRNFNPQLASDSGSVILNESAVRALDLQEEPIGAEVNKGMKVIGVVSDFHWESLRKNIAPLAIMLKNERTSTMKYAQLAVKARSGNIPEILRTAERLWKSRVTDEAIEYHFMDDNFGKLLEKESILGKAIGFFTGLAIMISCLGLFGLAAFTTEQRTKEISIRKVLGASTEGIVIMLSKQFTRLVFLSILIAVPTGYYAAQQWLSNFAYRTPLNASIFILAGCLGIVLSFLTVSFHAIRASKTNPADTLKYE